MANFGEPITKIDADDKLSVVQDMPIHTIAPTAAATGKVSEPYHRAGQWWFVDDAGVEFELISDYVSKANGGVFGGRVRVATPTATAFLIAQGTSGRLRLIDLDATADKQIFELSSSADATQYSALNDDGTVAARVFRSVHGEGVTIGSPAGADPAVGVLNAVDVQRGGLRVGLTTIASQRVLTAGAATAATSVLMTGVPASATAILVRLHNPGTVTDQFNVRDQVDTTMAGRLPVAPLESNFQLIPKSQGNVVFEYWRETAVVDAQLTIDVFGYTA